MLQDKLNELVMLSIDSEIVELLNYETLINNFIAQKIRKITKIISLYFSLSFFKKKKK